VIIALTFTACDKDHEEPQTSISIYMEIDSAGDVNIYDIPVMDRYLFGYPAWISDDYLLYSKAKLYRGSLDSYDYQQLLPDNIDCFGYGICHSVARQKIWFCNSDGIWSCNFAGGDITFVSPTPIKEMQLSSHGNFLIGYRIDRSQSLCLVDLATGIMEEQSTSHSVHKAFYNEDLQLISYLTYVRETENSFQVRVRSKDGSSELIAIDFGNISIRNFQVSASGRYVAGMASENGSISYPLYIHDLQTGETNDLGLVRSFQMLAQGDQMIFLPADGRYFKVSKYDFDTGGITDLHSGYLHDYRYYYLYKLIVREDGEKIRIYGWGKLEIEDRRIL
jgi:hypothetical protein